MVISFINLVFEYSPELSALIGVVLGIIAGLIANKFMGGCVQMEEMEKQMDERIGIALEITGWGLIAVGISFLLLKLFGLIHSPSELLINKFELLWEEFKKRKSL